MAAMAVRDRLARVGQKAWIGVTTGQAFCGIVGNQTRREYTVMGDVVNLAARLMTAAKGGKNWQNQSTGKFYVATQHQMKPGLLLSSSKYPPST